MEEGENFEEEYPQLSSRTLSFYGTHQRENKSTIINEGGNEFLVHQPFRKLHAQYVFHVCFQLSSIIDYVSKYNHLNIKIILEIKFIGSK
jgi:hypothetical protein